ncbi:hypothetical protein [Zooshikella harenae]|uniref:Uncharacterized protein n=1 Tax=Zooshikella harenae TaxID=2827238 RepID=A0ABS5ZIX8_9GAMM|nr:hypothetical protein [Zooshikella harenae]MBU2714039.1 hypothetical protein [Zooshikella harenae]
MKSGIKQDQKKSLFRKTCIILFFLLIACLFFIAGFYAAKKEASELLLITNIENEENLLTYSIYFSTLIRENKHIEAIKGYDKTMYLNFGVIANYLDILNNNSYACDNTTVRKLLEYYKKYNPIMYKELNQSCYDLQKRIKNRTS